MRGWIQTTHRSRVLAAFGVVLLGMGSAAAEPAPDGKIGPPPWTRLHYGLENLAVRVNTIVSVADRSGRSVQSALWTGANDALQPEPDDAVLVLNARIESHPKVPLMGPKAWEGTVWFLPEDARALQRTRLKLGNGGSRKVYRYSPTGVHRLRAEPDDRSEAKLPPTRWTQVRRSEYPFPDNYSECVAISDPSALIYIASTTPLAPGDPPIETCVFNKKTLYRVALRPVDERSIPIRYTAVRDGTAEQVERSADVLRIRVQAEPLDPGAPQREPFEMLGMEGGNVEILVDVAEHLPVRVSGELPDLGRVDFNLEEVTLTSPAPGALPASSVR